MLQYISHEGQQKKEIWNCATYWVRNCVQGIQGYFIFSFRTINKSFTKNSRIVFPVQCSPVFSCFFGQLSPVCCRVLESDADFVEIKSFKSVFCWYLNTAVGKHSKRDNKHNVLSWKGAYKNTFQTPLTLSHDVRQSRRDVQAVDQAWTTTLSLTTVLSVYSSTDYLRHAYNVCNIGNLLPAQRLRYGKPYRKKWKFSI